MMISRPYPLAGIIYFGLALFWTYPVSLSPAEMAPDYGDPLHLAYLYCWVNHQIVHDPLSLFDSNSFYPYDRSLAFTEHVLPESLLVAPFYWATRNPVLVYNASLILGLVASALSMFALVRHSIGSSKAAFLAGLVYAFSGFSLVEVYRSHVLHLQWWPLALLCLIRFAQSGTVRAAAGCAVFLALQGLTCTYFLVYTVVLFPFWMAAVYLGFGRRPRAVELGRLIGIGAIAAVPLVAYLWPYLENHKLVTTVRVLVEDSNDLFIFLRPSSKNILWGWITAFGGSQSGREFKGFIAGALMLAGAFRLFCWRRLDPPVRALGLIATLTCFVGITWMMGQTMTVGGLSMGPGPYRWLKSVPYAGSLRHLPRVNTVVLLGGAALLGVATQWLFLGMARAPRRILFIALAVIIPLEHWRPPTFGVAVPTGAHVPEVYRWIAENVTGPVADVPVYASRGGMRMRALYLYLSTFHWRKVPIGRSSFYPPGHSYLAEIFERFPDETSIHVASRMGITTLVVHPLMWPEKERAARLQWLRSHPMIVEKRRFTDALPSRFDRYGLGQEVVFEVLPILENHAMNLCTPMNEIERASWGLVSPLGGDFALARDGDPDTGWWNGRRKQDSSDRLRVGFRKTERIAAIVIELGKFRDSFPRSLAVEAHDPDHGWIDMEFDDGPEMRWETLSSLLRDPWGGRIVLRIPPRRTRKIRLSLTEEFIFAPWHVADLRLYRECR
ncbi:MAG: hypothetical protein JXO72_13855 [Vicinamibacteria bacterium]|nr:hypothetical protein [Vicinamibacteria bacterium]